MMLKNTNNQLPSILIMNDDDNNNIWRFYNRRN